MEDIDAAFPPEKVQVKSAEKGSGLGRGLVTLSGLLNAIDGIAAQEGSIVVLTTNHPDRLPASLLRPGRIDKRMYLGKADKDQVYRMFLKFFPADQFPDEDVEST